MVAPALEALGRVSEALASAKEFENTTPEPRKFWFAVFRACLEGDYRTAVEAGERGIQLNDPEARFCNACLLAKMNRTDTALKLLSLALANGYRCHHAFLHDRWLDSLRSDARFTELVSRAAEMSREARTVFLDNGGDRLLGISTAHHQP